jgi:hypothetical protein
MVSTLIGSNKKPKLKAALAVNSWKQVACLPYREGSPIAVVLAV